MASQILQFAEPRNPEKHASAWRTFAGISILALASLLTACQTVPESTQGPTEQIATYKTPLDLGGCDLSRSYVLGETFDYPGAIEIWACPGKTVVTLNQMLGRWPDRIRQMRSHLTAVTGPDEEVVGCKKDAVYYSDVVAMTSLADPLNPKVVRAWKADLDNWTFERTEPGAVVCNY